jgi:hypothetical protein
LNLYPDPVHFVSFLKEVDRIDISADLFVKLLEVYRDQKAQDGSDPMQFVFCMLSYSLAVFIHTAQDPPLPANNYADANSVVGWKGILEYTLQTRTFVILY